MKKDAKILLTGAAGFIGSCMLGHLNKKGFQNIIIADDFSEADKQPNYQDKNFLHKIDRKDLFTWLSKELVMIDFVFHLGARTDTTEFDYSVHEELNVAYSKDVWQFCTNQSIPLVYASSAATYGAGELGYRDDHEVVNRLKPLNPYGVSKNEFDIWALSQAKTPPHWAGLKFFNVYGPNEYHKGRMASVIFHSFNQIQKAGKVRLFKSHRPDFKDGEQLRDFIYVNDVVSVCDWFMDVWSKLGQDKPASGLYNLGTGKARSFNDLVNAIFASLGQQAKIEYFDTPEDIRDKYQYFTEADMNKLRLAGYPNPFYSLEKGVDYYVTNYLVGNKYF